MPLPFLDTNILLRHFLQDHADHSPRATAYLRRVEAGAQRVRMAVTVVFEVVFTLQRQYKVARPQIASWLLPIIDLPAIELAGKRQLHEVFDLYLRYNISFIDAYHAVLMRHEQLTAIVSFDEDFDRLPGTHRVEP